MARLGLHSSHDATVALEIEGEYKVLELERYYEIRHFDLSRSSRTGLRAGDANQFVTRGEVAELVHKLYGVSEFESAALIGRYKSTRSEAELWAPWIHAEKWTVVPHHLSHAACAYYQSPFDRALIISYDGGGNDGFFRAFEADRKNGVRYSGPDFNLNLGAAYATLAFPIREIHKAHETVQGASLRNAGRLMGLGAYGVVRSEWVEPVREFYMQFPHEFPRARSRRLPALGEKIGLDFTAIRDCVEGKEAFDFAATAEHVFTEIFFETIAPLLRIFKDVPICLSGGCALNVLVNERLARTIGPRNLFVPPNPNDGGLALGALWQTNPPKQSVNITYAGLPLLDLDEYPQSGPPVDFNNPRGVLLVSPADVAYLLAYGKIIGVARGNSEHGPRALGNRSILANPSVPGLKDRLNHKVKFREAFRPYAPVVRKEDAKKYFDCEDYDMSYMSFCPKVRPEWRAKLKAITHEDGTARVQTVTRKQNPWLYDVLTEFEKIADCGVLLNTSFNTRGKPILTTVREALHNLDTTDLDYVVVEDRMYCKDYDNQSSNNTLEVASLG